ncbi:MAG: MBL fold metallo-hydrolase [Clostridia bacterium]|nr:MBL fold metallo-hydrolase [Clostridia bacterium]
MSTKLKTLLSLLIAVLLLAGAVAVLPACEKAGGDTTTEPESTSAPDTEPAPTDNVIKLVVDGEPQIAVIRADKSDTSSADVQAAMKIRTAINGYTEKGQTKIDTDWSKDGKHDSSTLEILVGNTTYEETATGLGNVGYGDYAVKLVGNKILVLGYTDDAISYAATVLTSLIKANAKKDEATNLYTVEIKPEDINYSGTRSKTISQLPTVEGGTFLGYYNAGDDCDEIIVGKTDMDAYKSYISKLESTGYKTHVTNDVQGNSFATLYNDKFTLNVGYYNYEKSIRVIMEPFSPESLPGLEADNKYDVVTTSQVTMIGLEYQTSSGYSSNGLSILIRLADGRFIVVDGGFNRSKDMQMLIEQMKEQSKDYVAKTGGIKVAGWIITHAHGDHQGCINGQWSQLANNKIKVERFYINFLADEERNKAINTYLSNGSSNWSSGEGGGWSSTYSAAAGLGAVIKPVHVGQVFWLADLRMETLYTIESYGPKLANALNTTSLIFKMTFKDPKTGAETVYMSTGDATGPGFDITQKMYGNYLKSDIVQVAHHGYTTWGTESGTTSAYIKMAPPTLAWPQGIKAYPNYVNKSYNKVLWDTNNNPNYKETLVAGWAGSITIFPMPYTVGSAIVKEVKAPN